MKSKNLSLELTHDEGLVLDALFGRFDDTDRFEFAHVAEFIALGRLTAQLDKSFVEIFDRDYKQLLAAARDRVAGDADPDDYPGPKIATPDV